MLAKVSGVNKEWRRECVVRKREEAVALVTAPATDPDRDLSRPQQALHGLLRVLRGRNPFSGAQVPELREPPLFQDFWEQWQGENGVDLYTVAQSRYKMGSESETAYSLSEVREGVSVLKVYMYVRFRHLKPASRIPCPRLVSIHLQPQSPEECMWM